MLSDVVKGMLGMASGMNTLEDGDCDPTLESIRIGVSVGDKGDIFMPDRFDSVGSDVCTDIMVEDLVGRGIDSSSGA